MNKLLRAAVALVAVAACRPTQVAVAEVTLPDAAPSDAGAASDTATPTADGGCTVSVGSVVSANVYRGVRDTPAHRASREALDPQTRARWEGRDHGVTYLLCAYRVRMNGSDYTYEYEAAQNVIAGERLDISTCAAAETVAKVALDVRQTTKECTEPHAGAYWGSDLVPTP